MIDTPSRVALIFWMEKDPKVRTQAFICRALGMAERSSVRKWLFGQNRPEAHMRLALEYLTEGEVKVPGWMTEKEAALVERMREARGSVASAHASPRTLRKAAGM